MGNSHTTFNSLHKVVATDYQLVGKNTSIRWGELFEMKNTKTGQMVFMQEKHAVDLETHQKTVEECTYHISLTHKNLSTIYGFAGGESLDAFTNTYKVCVFFEHVINSLNGVIRARRVPLPSQNKNQQRYTQAFQYFDESELLRFMNQLVEVFGFLQRNGINQGDVTPDVCFFSREGALKVLDRKLIYNDVSSFEQAEQGNTNIFLTPTELGALANDKAKPSENRYKADVFRLGMTLLECATLQKSSEIYDWNSYIINLDILSSRLIEVKERYSSSFYDPLREMLRFEEDKRPDFIVLCRHLEEEAAKNLAANMAQQYGEDDIEGRKSIFGMGPKLITNFPVKLGVSPSTKGQNMMSYDPSPAKRGSVKVQQVGRESRETFEKRAQRNSAMVVNKKEEDLDDTTEFESDMKVNKVPFTETRLSVERIKVNDSPARRLQKRISENNSVEKKNTSPDVSLHQSPSNTPRQRFSLTLKDFFRRDSPNRTSALQENPSAKKDKEEAPKVPHNSSPKMTFGDLSSTNRHRRVMSGAPNFSYQSPIHNTNGINPPKSRKQPDAAGDSPSHSFDLRSKPPYGNGTIRHTRTPTLPLPAKEYLNSTVSGYRNANDNSISQNDGISPSEYYTASSNPATQRVSGQRLSYKGNGVSESILAGDNGDVSISIDPSEALGVSIDEQRRQTATNRTRPSHIPEESQASRVASMVPQAQGQNGGEGEKGNEQDLIETILRRVLNSAGISPKKQNNIVLVDNRVELGYAKPQSLIRPLQIEMNENIERVEERPSVQKYNVENARASYNSSGSTYNKLGLQGVRDERRVSARPLEDQYNQSMDPRAVVSPKFGFRGISVERKSVIDEIRGSIAMEKNRPYGENGGNNWEPSSAGMKSSMAPKSYLDTPMGMNVEDRFEQAMERSRRSKGFMRDLAGKINRSSSRTTSAEPSMRGSHVAGGLMFGNGYFSNNNHEIGLNQ